MLFALGYIWALPTTAIGLVLALGGLCVPVAFRSGAVWFRATACSPWSWWWAGNFAAITIGGCVILAQSTAVEDVATHEMRHFLQARVLGPFFLPVYLVLSLWALIRTGDAYWENPLEADARRAAGEA